jgi:NADH-quinone oxidoreductase subunit F
MAYELVLTKNVGNPAVHTVEGYKATGGYAGLTAAYDIEPDAVIDLVKASGLRGRGGAGFPAGLKWSFIPKGNDKPKYLVCNADESEPGTFKDRLLMEHDPHQLIEGCAICCYAVQANTCYIYIRGEYTEAARILEEAIADAYAQGILGEDSMGRGFKLDMRVHRGAGAYICGEETGMLESLEGKRGQPRVKPPFPAVVGAFGCPTVINNVETICNVPHIMTRGVEWYTSLGTDERNTGPKLYCISGHVEKPGTYEFPIGVPFREILEAAGGMWRGGTLQAFIPGGASAAMLKADQIDIPMDFDNIAKAGSMLGSAAIMVLDDQTCVVTATARLASFFSHESCGQCTPCREGTNWSELLLRKIAAGQGTMADIDLLDRVANNMSGTALCALADACVGPVANLVKNFRPELEACVEAGGSPYPERRYFSQDDGVSA